MSGPWYWCLDHAQVEPAAGCPNDRRLGPYEQYDDAVGAIDRVRARTKEMDDADRADADWGQGWGENPSGDH